MTKTDTGKEREVSPLLIAGYLTGSPFVAGCKLPERSAFGNLCLYLAEKQSITGPGDHCPEDDASVYERLRLLMNFEDGNITVITHGIKILALIMLTGYNRSKEKDNINGIYNPLNKAAWNFDQLTEKLTSDIHANPCPELDEIVPAMNFFSVPW